MEINKHSGNTGYEMDTSDGTTEEPKYETRSDQNAEPNEMEPLSTADIIESVEPHFLSLFPALSTKFSFPSFSEVWHRKTTLS